MSYQVSPDRRRDVLRVLKEAREPMSIKAIAEVLDVHPNTVRFHLGRLISDSQVALIEPARKGPGRPPLMFSATPRMDRTGPRHYQLLAEILAMGLAAEGDPSSKALATGRAWGRKLETPAPPGKRADRKGSQKVAIDYLVGVLDELGFEPEHRRSGAEQHIGLRHCPFLELAEIQGNVICPIHLGFMQGVMESRGAPVTVDRLEAFVEPGLCLAHITHKKSESAQPASI